jgi:hypothetical protein
MSLLIALVCGEVILSTKLHLNRREAIGGTVLGSSTVGGAAS